MSAWWFLLIVPAAASLGALQAALFNTRSHDRGWRDGYEKGWAEGWAAGTAWDVTVTKTEVPS